MTENNVVQETPDIEQMTPSLAQELTEQDWKMIAYLLANANDSTAQGKIALGLLLQKVQGRLG